MTRLVRKKIRIFHPVSLSGMDINDAIQLLTQLKQDLGENLKFECQYDYDGIYEISLEGTREETDTEYETRLKKHLASAEKRKKATEAKKLKAEEKARAEEEALRKLYEQLKQKFEVFQEVNFQSE